MFKHYRYVEGVVSLLWMTSSFSYAGTGSPLDSLHAAGSEKKSMLGVLPGTGLNASMMQNKEGKKIKWVIDSTGQSWKTLSRLTGAVQWWGETLWDMVRHSILARPVPTVVTVVTVVKLVCQNCDAQLGCIMRQWRNPLLVATAPPTLRKTTAAHRLHGLPRLLRQLTLIWGRKLWSHFPTFQSTTNTP